MTASAFAGRRHGASKEGRYGMGKFEMRIVTAVITGSSTSLDKTRDTRSIHERRKQCFVGRKRQNHFEFVQGHFVTK